MPLSWCITIRAKESTMYLPPQFNAKNRADAADVVRQYAFASLISNDEDGVPFVTHLPLHLVEQGDDWTLLGHCAKPNPHWRYLQARPQAVVTFMGPHAYMSPKVYPDLARVPTWNYLAVHCVVTARIVDEPAAKDALLKKLIGDHEPPYAQQWRDLGTDYQHKMLAGIVAFELKVDKLECKLKVNQHRTEAHAGMRAAYAQGNENEQALVQWMDRLGI
jgi:transcriptional regulator